MSAEIAEQTRFIIADDVVTEEIEDEVVLLDLQGDVYFSLNPVARCIWNAIRQGKDFAAVVDAVCAQFEVERETARDDAKAFIDDVLERDLVSIDDGR